jgi:hypothetical protein
MNSSTVYIGSYFSMVILAAQNDEKADEGRVVGVTARRNRVVRKTRAGNQCMRVRYFVCADC